MSRIKASLIALGTFLTPLSAWAGDHHVVVAPDGFPQVAIGFGASTMGTGLVVDIHAPGALLGLRARANLFHFTLNLSSNASKTQTQAHLQNESIILDYYPWHGGFRVSGGVVFNQNNASFTSTPQLTGALLGFVQQTHYNGAIGNVHGPITFNPIAPYLGVGYVWDLRDHWTISADFGAMYQGNGHIHLGSSGLIASNPSAQAALEANARKADSMISKMSFYPIADLDVIYRF